ncbi:MAG: hypothetical protein E7632_12955 [Ruminococcaceae bacterium]|nr:hypothetical protein [Oscillospiraceae bacterium]
MKIKRSLSMLILMSMLASLSACGSGEGTTDSGSSGDTANAVDTTAADDIYSIRAELDDGLPVKDYGGADFTIATYTALLDHYQCEEQTGDVVDDAIFFRNIAVEERFNINLCYDYNDDYMTASGTIRKNVLAGENAHDLVAHHIVDMGNMAAEGLFLNLLDQPNIDLTKPWWSQKAAESLTYKHKVLCLGVGDYSLSSVSYTGFFAFNKVQLLDYQMTPDDLYNMVREGKWTLDSLSEIVKNVYQDLNGNTVKDAGDYFGLANIYAGANTYLAACDNPIVENNTDGVPELVYYQDKTSSAAEKIMALLFENPGVITGDYNKDGNIPLEMFMDGTTLFAPSDLASAYISYRSNEDPFGALPYPKYDEAQIEYLTVSGGSGAGLAIPLTTGDAERSAIITEALCAESYKQVIPAFVETALKVKLADDPDTVEMIDIILNGRVYDPGFIYHYENGFGFTLQHLCTSPDRTNITSYYERRKPSYTKFLDSMIEKFEALITE